MARPVRPFEAFVQPSTNGCHHWAGYIDRSGYPHFTINRGDNLAHRVAYERHHGVHLPKRGEPDHRQVDHECHNRSKSCPGGSSCMHRRCVNPAHLTLATPKENTEASAHTPAHQNRRKTHCSKGHEFTPENTYAQVRKNGTTVSRSCKRCQIANRTRNRRLQQARRAAVA